MPNSNDISWIAGFFEGEGSVGCYKRTDKRGSKVYHSYAFKVCIAQKEHDVLLWIKDLLGYGSLNHRQNKSSYGQDLWIWEAHNNQALQFLEMIKPYMRTKRKTEQMITALSNRARFRKRK